MTIEEMYIRYKGEARAAAKRVARQFQRPVHEAEDHADFALAMVLLQHLDDWDEEILPLDRWLYMRVRFHLIQVFSRGRHPYMEDVRETPHREKAMTRMFQEWDRGTVPAPSAMESKLSRIQQMLSEVGQEGAALLQILRDLPSDLWEEIRPRRGRTREKKEENFRAWLVDSKDWSHERVEQAVREVMDCL